MNIVVTGGTGFIGTHLTRELLLSGHTVVVLTRNKEVASLPGLTHTQWDGSESDQLVSVLSRADAVINLAGKSIAGRWSKRKKREIVRSHVGTTRTLVSALTKANRKPTVFISASAVGYYGDQGNEVVTEQTGRGEGFLSETVDAWEQEAQRAASLGVRTALLRMGVVLGKGGGALTQMQIPFAFFAGGPIGSGNQWFPWVHLDDVRGAVDFALRTPGVSGPVNVVAPQVVTTRQFCGSLGRALHRPSWLPVPAFALRLLLGEMSSMLLTGQRVMPVRLMDAGYSFIHPNLDEALLTCVR